MSAAPDRGYQAGFSRLYPDAAADRASRERKARTLVAVLADFLGGVDALRTKKVLDVGASNGVMDTILAGACGHVTGIDIDGEAIQAAQAGVTASNLEFHVGDGMALEQADASIDIVICAHVYEHVPDATRLLAEIRRVLKAGGVCYFAAGNRFQWMEPHYRLPLLSVLPRLLAHAYLRLLGRGEHYYEKHLSLPALRRLVRGFTVHDYTARLIRDPARYGVDYMLPPGSLKALAARSVLRFGYGLVPTYIWLLERPAE